MANTVTIDAKTFNIILARLDKLAEDVAVIKHKVLSKGPKYGSDEWWEEEIREAKKDFKRGKGIKFNSAKDALQWLNS